MKKRSWLRRVLQLLLAVTAITLLGTTVLVLAGLQDDTGKADVALVLGSKVDPGGTPSARLCARLDKTLELYRAGHFANIITSGGTGAEGYDEALIMRDYLVDHGVPSGRIIIDSDGINTFASARNTLKIARQQQFRSVFVISQYFHIPRARLALRRFGFATGSAPGKTGR